MRAATPPSPAWIAQRERGMLATIRLMVWIALTLGRGIARLLLYPICLYYMLAAPESVRISRRYLARTLPRPPRLRHVFRHFHTFGSCVLDRVYLLNNQIDRFDLDIIGEDVVIDCVRQRQGCLLFGAHLGSFEVLRAIGRRQQDLRVSILMYESRKINAVLNAINPALALDIISLGRATSMMEIGQRLSDGGFVGILADRSLEGDEDIALPFLGAPARFPLGPFRMAVLMRRPVVLMIGLYRGGRRYAVHFERLFDPSSVAPGEKSELVREAVARYAGRLEHYCRQAPYNWFNFYDFWR